MPILRFAFHLLIESNCTAYPVSTDIYVLNPVVGLMNDVCPYVFSSIESLLYKGQLPPNVLCQLTFNRKSSTAQQPLGLQRSNHNFHCCICYVIKRQSWKDNHKGTMDRSVDVVIAAHFVDIWSVIKRIHHHHHRALRMTGRWAFTAADASVGVPLFPPTTPGRHGY